MNADQSSAQPAEAPKPINGAQLVSLINALRKLPWPMTYEVYDSLIQEFGWQLIRQPDAAQSQNDSQQYMHYDGGVPLLATVENGFVESVGGSVVVDMIHELSTKECRELYDEYCAAGTAAWGWPTDVRHKDNLAGTIWKGFAPQTLASREHVSININEMDKTIMFVVASRQTGAPHDNARRRVQFSPIRAPTRCPA